MANVKNSAVAGYIIVALILGVITYVEFAIVEYPQEWLGRNWTMFWLIALSVVKFIMVVMYFMHLKGDDSTYTGFFSSGMFITMATFIALTAMFILPRAIATTQPQDVQAGRASHDVPPEIMDLVETDGFSRTPAARADSPRPADRSVRIEPPLAGNDASSYELNLPMAAGTDATADGTADGTDATGATDPEDTAQAGGTDAEDAEAGGTDAQDAGTDADASGGTTAEGAESADTEEAADGTGEEATGEDAESASLTWDTEQGASVYNANCVACHQGSGQGIPGAFPPLADHAADIYAAGGETYLIDVLLYGLQGAIQVDGATYNGFMPAWGQFSDEQTADVLNHIVTNWNEPPADFVPYQADDIAAERDKGLSPGDVHALREQLGL